MTITHTEFDIELLINFDDTPACEIPNINCDKEPVWVFVTNCCDKSVMMCQEHHDKQMAFLDCFVMVACQICQTDNVPSGSFFKSITRL